MAQIVRPGGESGQDNEKYQERDITEVATWGALLGLSNRSRILGTMPGAQRLRDPDSRYVGDGGGAPPGMYDQGEEEQGNGPRNKSVICPEDMPGHKRGYVNTGR